MYAIDTAAFATSRPQATPAEIEAWLDQAREVTGHGLDFGLRRRVGIWGERRNGIPVVIEWSGRVSGEFPGSHYTSVVRLDAEVRAEVRRSIYREEGLPLDGGRA